MSANTKKPAWETSDASTRPLFFFLGGLALLIAVSLLVSAWVLNGMSSKRAGQVRPHPMEGFQTRPNGPLLQAKPSIELDEHHRYEAQLLGRFAWIDPQQGIVRIPIEHAMDLLLERGIPSRGQGEQR